MSSNLRPSTANSTASRSKSAAGSIFAGGRKVVQWLAHPFHRPNITGQTPQNQINQLLAAQHGLDPNDDYKTLHHFSDATEADVFLLESETTGKRYIEKITHPVHVHDYRDLQAKDTQTHKYPNEARTLIDNLKPHPGITSILACETDYRPGSYSIMLAYCDGGDLTTQLDFIRDTRKTIVQEPFLLHVLVEMVDILAYIHHGLRHTGNGKYTLDKNHKSIVHGDVKEDNIFLRWDTDHAARSGLPSLVLGDWGTAKIAGSTNNNLGPGTWVYHSPEDVDIYRAVSFENASNREVYQKLVDTRTVAVDIYALGHIMYRLATLDRKQWTIGSDPQTLVIPKEYETPGLREVIASLLVVDPVLRGEASFREGTGLLGKIQEMRLAKDEMLKRRGRPAKGDWFQS